MGKTPAPGIEPGSPEGPRLAISCNTIMRYWLNKVAGVGFEPHDLRVMGPVRTPDSSIPLYIKSCKLLINLTILKFMRNLKKKNSFFIQ